MVHPARTDYSLGELAHPYLVRIRVYSVTQRQDAYQGLMRSHLSITRTGDQRYHESFSRGGLAASAGLGLGDGPSIGRGYYESQTATRTDRYSSSLTSPYATDVLTSRDRSRTRVAIAARRPRARRPQRLWTEDDVPYIGRETAAEAYVRMFGKDLPACNDRNLIQDMGDAFAYSTDECIVVLSYPGNSCFIAHSEWGV